MNSDANRRPVEQPADDVQLGLQRRHRLERFAELHIYARALGPPVCGINAASHEQRGKPPGKWAGRIIFCWFSTPNGNRLQPGERHSDPSPAEECAPREVVNLVHLVCHSLASFPLPLFVRNCRLVTIVSIRPPKRLSAAASFCRMSLSRRSSDGKRVRPSA